MTTNRHPQQKLSLVYAIGIPVVIAFGAVVVSTVYFAGFYLYTTYLQPKTELVELEIKRQELRALELKIRRGEK